MVKKVIWYLLLQCVLTTLIFAGVFVIKPITRIKCVNQYGVCDDSILEEVAIVGERPYIALSKATQVLANKANLESFSVEYGFPSTLTVKVDELKPRYAIYDRANNTYFLVGGDLGLVLSEVKATNLPFVEVGEQKLTQGQTVDTALNVGLTLLHGLYVHHNIKRALIEDGVLYANIPEGKTAIFPLTGDSQLLLGSLNLILSQLNTVSENSRIDNSLVSVIDLRYKNPVLR